MERESDALETALTAHFECERLGGLGLAYLYASSAPSLLLWIHAWHPLPGAIAWLAVLAWGACAALAVILTTAAWKWQARLLASLPEARRVVRVRFASSDGMPAASSLLVLLAVATSGVLWLNAALPGAVAAHTLSLAQNGWALLLAAALANGILEVL